MLQSKRCCLFLLVLIISILVPKRYSFYSVEALDIDHPIYHIEKQNYLGTISFPKYHITRTIRYGVDADVLEHDIGLLDLSYSLDDNYGNIVLAGHNRKNAFHILYSLKKGDEIILSTERKKFSCHVTAHKNIFPHDFQYFELSSTKKILTLVTCSPNNKKRLIVRALCE